MKLFLFVVAITAPLFGLHAEDGYRLWLRYDKIDNAKLLTEYQHQITGFQFNNTNASLHVAKKELLKGLQGLLAKKVINFESLSTFIFVFLKNHIFDPFL